MEKKYEESVRLINWFCEKEYNDVAFEEYEDLSRIPLAYTTTCDGEHDIQIYANLPAMRVEYTLDGKTIETDSFKTMEEMEWFFQWMEFDALVAVVDLHESV